MFFKKAQKVAQAPTVPREIPKAEVIEIMKEEIKKEPEPTQEVETYEEKPEPEEEPEIEEEDDEIAQLEKRKQEILEERKKKAEEAIKAKPSLNLTDNEVVIATAMKEMSERLTNIEARCFRAGI